MDIKFGAFHIDLEGHRLLKNGAAIHVEPQVFDLIVFLAQQAGKLVTKDALVDHVWNGLAVSDATINARVSAARKALDDDGRQQNVIRTVHKRGFEFCGLDAKAPQKPKPSSGLLNYAKSQDGTAIAWSKAGSGPPLVRLGHWMSHLHLHLDRDCPVWAPLIERLEQNFDLIRYDVRGTGLSERGAPLSGLQCFVDDLNAVLSASGIQKTSLYASSQAVPIAVAFAHQFLEKVDKMVLWGGSCDGRKIRKQGDNHLDMDTAVSLVKSAWGQNGGVFQEAFNRLFMPDADADQIKSIAQTQRQTADAQTAVDLRQTVDAFSVSDLLEHVTTQTLVIHANQDAIHPFSEGQKLVAGLPNADISMLESRNHVPLPQDPNWPGMVDAITQFLLFRDR